ncbi:polysaccharide lyase family 20 protein [Durotheca rogersii]|uniref:polysaccharide lyase family 20 protein n=1 Tax=Durotheca rogersii TaxID=419775 RepID=UPI002220A4FE|nr:polysaccharide lyase family 20 protein [Durotheca rogersii]KAI5864604.1 polysaccharide lyase family 20 protein [Durotheca rogersii]
MRAFKITALALLASPLLASATMVFKNSGTKAGWDGINQEHQGTVSQVKDETYRSDTALRMVQVYDANYRGRYHSEVYKKDVYREGDEGYYGFAFRLDPGWDTSSKQSFNVAQFIADLTKHPDNRCGDGYIPSMMLWVEGDRLQIRRKGGDMCAASMEKYTLGRVTPGAWHRVVLRARWSSTKTGSYRVWLDGKEVLARDGIVNAYRDSQRRFGFQFRVGLYANGWHDKGRIEGTQRTRRLWIDEVGIGNTYAEADPGKRQPRRRNVQDAGAAKEGEGSPSTPLGFDS